MLKIVHLEHFVYEAFFESYIGSQDELSCSSASPNFWNISAVLVWVWVHCHCYLLVVNDPLMAK